MSRPRCGIRFRRQPTKHTCGQTCIAMLADVSVDSVIAAMGRRGKTTTADVVKGLRAFGLECDDKRTLFRKPPTELPNKLLLLNVSARADGRVYWRHWLLYHARLYFDPGWGIWTSFPLDWAQRGAVIGSYLEVRTLRLLHHYESSRSTPVRLGTSEVR